MDLKYNKNIAIAAYILIALFSIIVLGGNKLKQIYNTGEEYFTVSGLGDSESISSVIKGAAGQASNMSVLIDKTDYSSKEYEDFKYLITSVREGTDINKVFEDYVEMCSYAEYFYENRSGFDLSDQDNQYMIEIMGNIYGSQRIIEYSHYYEQAHVLNEQLNKFPASLIRSIRGINLLPVFTTYNN